MRPPVRIDIEDHYDSDSTLDRRPYGLSTSSSPSQSTSSSFTNSPIRVPVANRISDAITNAVPFQFASSINSFRTTYTSDNSYDSDEYEEENFHTCNRSVMALAFINIFPFFLFSAINKNSLDNVNPHNDKMFLQCISEYPHCTDLRPEIWRLFSYSMVHSGIGHLIGNMFGLVFCLMILYRFQYFRNTIIVYFVSVINGGLSFYLTNPYDILVGASGGVYGIFGGNIANYIYNNDVMLSGEKCFLHFFYIVFTIIDISVFFSARSENVSYQSHWYSLLFGLLTGLSIFKEFRPVFYKKCIRLIGIILFCYLNAMLVWNYTFNFPASFKLNYFEMNNVESCCYDKYMFNEKNTTFICDRLYENKFI